jgi:hypothetical protein
VDLKDIDFRAQSNLSLNIEKVLMILPLALVGDDDGLEFAVEGEYMGHTLVEVVKTSLCSDPSTLVENIAE